MASPVHLHRALATTRNALAYGLAESGQVDAAIAEFRAPLADQVRLLRPDAPDTLWPGLAVDQPDVRDRELTHESKESGLLIHGGRTGADAVQDAIP